MQCILRLHAFARSAPWCRTRCAATACPGLPGTRCLSMLSCTFVVSEEDAAAIRAAFDQGGEFAAAVELRRLFPGITDTEHARASPIPSMPGHVPGRSHAGSRWYCRRGRLCDHPSWRAGEWVAAPRVPWSVGRRLAGATVTRSLRCRCDRGATPLSRPGPGLPRQSDPRGQPKAHDVVPPEGAPCLSPARHCS